MILVLTGSIETKAGRNTVSDPKLRSSEYARAIRFYLERTELPLRFLENSNYPLEEDPEWEDLLNSERLSFFRDPRSGDPERGKGHEEFLLLDRAVEQLAEEGHSAIFKVTGRYIVRNIDALIPDRNDRPYFDLHPRIKSGIAISSLFACPIAYYRSHIKGLYAEVNEAERITIEKLLFQRLNALGASQRPHLLPCEPDLKGLSGTWGTPIGRNPYRRKARNLFRSVLRAGGWRSIPYEL